MQIYIYIYIVGKCTYICRYKWLCRVWYFGNGNVNGHGNSKEPNAMYVCNGNIWEYCWRLGYFLMTLRCNRWDIRHILSLRYLGDICVHIIRLYLYGGLGWWFGSLGNQSYVQNRFEQCFFFWCVCVLYLFYFLFN